MSTKVKAFKKCPTFTKEVITFDKKGKKVVKTVTVDDHFLVIMNSGCSIAVSKEQLKEFGITDIVTSDKTSKIVETLPEIDEDDDLVEDTEVTNSVQATGLVSGSNI